MQFRSYAKCNDRWARGRADEFVIPARKILSVRYTVRVRTVSVAILALVFQVSISVVGAQQMRPSGLIAAADAIVVARVSDTDYTRTPADGPMTARAEVLAVVKGSLRKNQSFGFTETAWVGPEYRVGELRILFLESAGTNSWRVLSNLYAKSNFLIESEAIPLLNANSLKSVLEGLPVPPPKSIFITKAMLR